LACTADAKIELIPSAPVTGEFVVGAEFTVGLGDGVTVTGEADAGAAVPTITILAEMTINAATARTNQRLRRPFAMLARSTPA
jgi:hypothetical protein